MLQKYTHTVLDIIIAIQWQIYLYLVYAMSRFHKTFYGIYVNVWS